MMDINICLDKVEYHANAEYDNPLKNLEKNSMCWSNVTLSNNEKKKNFLTSIKLTYTGIK